MRLRSAAILAVLLLALPLPAGCRPGPARAEEAPAFLDPALLPAWALLVGVEVEGGRRLGAELEATREEAGVRIVVGPVPLDGYGQYQPSKRHIVVSAAIMGEDPRALAAVLAHELVHVRQDLQGRLHRRDCAMLEAWALASQSQVWWTLTGGEMPSGTRLERALTRNAALVREKGLLGVWGGLPTGTEAGRACVVW